MSGHATVGLFVPHLGCPHRCSFCDQRSITGRQGPLFPEEVIRTAERALTALGDRAKETELAFFGGSFTAIPAEERTALLKAAWPFVRDGRFRGIRCSTRPDSINEKALEELKAYGATTVELGAQSMDNGVLLRNGRGHTAENVRGAASLVREAGLAIGLQMMTGLPGDSPEGARRTAWELAALSPREVRIYPALVLRGTELEEWYRAGSYTPPSLEESVALCAELLDFFEEKGIRVIRLGLHDSGELRETLLAGPYHPAFRELCESRRWFSRFLKALEGVPEGAVTLRVPGRFLSQAVGQKRENIRKLAALGYAAAILPEEVCSGCI